MFYHVGIISFKSSYFQEKTSINSLNKCKYFSLSSTRISLDNFMYLGFSYVRILKSSMFLSFVKIFRLIGTSFLSNNYFKGIVPFGIKLFLSCMTLCSSI
jgi:hypothetical protein